MTDAGALGEAYRDLTELDRRPEGIRFSATLPDGTPVVVLAIARDVGACVVSLERFAAEFERAASVHHEGLVPPVTWGTLSDGTLHCAYGRPDVEDLAPGSLSPTTVARIGARLAGALDAAHDAGLVHGAITTARIVMARARGAQLGDLGLFAALSEGGLGPQSASSLLNPPGYASPEVLVGEAPASQSDIYSLGASLYELLTGKPPYGGRMTSYVLASVLSEGEVSGESSSPETPPNSIVDALMRAIERAPEDRWQSADAFASALVAGASTGERPVANKTRRGCLATATVVVVAAAVVSAVIR